MLKALIAFFVLWVGIVAGVTMFRQYTNQEKIEFLKLLVFGLVAAIMSMSALVLLVFLF